MQESNPVATPEVTTPVAIEQPKQSNFLTILLSILLIISVAISGYFAYQTQMLVKELSTLKTQDKSAVDTLELAVEPIATESSEIDPTADWKTYTNSKFNFSFKYPAEMSYIYDQSDQYVEDGLSNAMILVQNFQGTKPRTETNDDFQIVVYISNKSGAFNLEDPQGDQTEVVINGVKAIKSFTTQKWVSVPTVFFQSSPNKIAVQLSNPESTNKIWFDQILSTFKFLE